MSVVIERYHDFCMGHTVTGHESKCAHLHGHNYRVTVTVRAPNLDSIGRVVDFSFIKDMFFEWIEKNYDHKFMVYDQDNRAQYLKAIDPRGTLTVDFNPTAENIAAFFCDEWNKMLGGSLEYGHLIVTKVKLEETRKCSVTVEV